MIGGENEMMGDLTSIYKDVLLNFVMNGGYADLEEMIGGVVDSFNIDTITAQYGSVENYLSVILSAQLIGAVITANEYKVHSATGNMESFESCADNIKNNVVNLTSFMLKEVKGGNDLLDILDFICNEDYLGLLATGSVCGISVDGKDLGSIYDVDSALNGIMEDIEKYDSMYDGEGNYNLEVYYPAIADNIDAFIYAFLYSYSNNNYIELDYEYVREALVDYLGSENGPVAELNICNILLAIGATSLAVIYSNEMILDSDLAYEEPTIGFYNLADEKWYVYGSDEPLTEEVTVLEAYGNENENYTSEIAEYPYTDAYGDVYGEEIYSVYYITVGDEVYVSYDETVLAVFDEMFELLIGGIGAEIAEEDQMMIAAAMLAYTMTYPEQDNYEGKLMDHAFASRFILSALSDSVLEGADDALESVALLLGYEKAPETPDEDAFYVENFVDEWLKVVEIPEGETLTTEEYLITMIIEVLISDSVRYELLYYYGPGVTDLIAIYLAAKYLGDTETGDAVFPGEELEDGLPVLVVGGLLGEYARLNQLPYDYDEVVEFVVEYYEGEFTKIVNYEDIIAIFLALNTYDLESIVNYEYAFDYVEHNMIGMLLDGLMSKKYSFDNNQYEFASAVTSALLEKIYYVEDNSQIPTHIVLVDFIWVVLAADLNDTELSDMMDMFKSAVDNAMAQDQVDVATYPVDATLVEYIIPVLFSDVDDGSGRYIDYLLAKLLPTQTEDARVALADTLLGMIQEALVGFEGIKGLDSKVLVGLLSDISVLLSENGLDTSVLDDIVAAIVALDDELDLEALLDIIMAENFGDDKYVVLTDVVLALMGGTEQELLAAIAAAKTALADDLLAVGYLRALEAQVNGAQPDNDGILNAIALMYLAEYRGEDVSKVIVPALFMTADEFESCFDFEVHYPDVYTVRAWADKYIALYNENGTVNVLEMAVDFLVASDYYDDEEIPAATDKLYYEKLGAIYAANEFFCNDEYADAFVDTVFNPDNIYLYGETFLELAESIEVTDRASMMLKLAFYVMSTKGYLDLEDSTGVEWDRVLAYIPEIYESYTGEKLEIANYAAFAELLRPAFADDVNAAFEATVVPYKTATEYVYVFTVYGNIQHVAVDGNCEIVIEIRVPKAA